MESEKMDKLLLMCLFFGGLGGLTFHLYWLISLSEKLSGKAMDPNTEDSKFRIKVMFLKIATGAVAGFIIYVWNMYAISSEYHQIAVISFVAGLSGDGFLGFIRKMAKV
jgi:hypothetical protein